MLAHGLEDNAPALDGVALFAVRAHLPHVNVCVAIRTMRPYVGEHGFGMALRASHMLVLPAQWVACLVMIELRNGADGFPPGRGVTVLAGDRQIAVGAARNRGAGLSKTLRSQNAKQCAQGRNGCARLRSWLMLLPQVRSCLVVRGNALLVPRELG